MGLRRGCPVTAALRACARSPSGITEDPIKDGYTDLREIISPNCGDDGMRDYSEIPAELQNVRGPYADDEAAWRHWSST